MDKNSHNERATTTSSTAQAVPVSVWRRACVACAQAKRQCTKQVPRCRRCLEKGLLCTYPPPRRPEPQNPQISAGVTAQNNGALLFPSGTTAAAAAAAAAAISPVNGEEQRTAPAPVDAITAFGDFGINIGIDMPGEEADPDFIFPQITEQELQSLRLLNGYTNHYPHPHSNTILPDSSSSTHVPRTASTTTSSSSSASSYSFPSHDAHVTLRRDTAWFLAPETWAVELSEPPPMTTREIEQSLKHFIEQVKLWMQQWVTEGHSPIHHRELYTFDMPRHTQDAYTAISMYFNNSKSPDAESTTHRILEDRVAQLLQDQFINPSSTTSGSINAGNDSSEGKIATISIFKHLSRVQALLSYQVIRLFDGDIRMRAQAEELIPTLVAWNRQMLDAAKENLGRPEMFLVSSSSSSASPCYSDGLTDPLFAAAPDITTTAAAAAAAATAQYYSSSSTSSSKAPWRAWILAESVRRTWQATGIVQEIYRFLKLGWSECPGRLPSTMRKALWDAPSASSWAARLEHGGDDDDGRGIRERERGSVRVGVEALLIPMSRLEDVVFARTAPDQVDDFNVAALALYGMERADRWLEGKGMARGNDRVNDRRSVLPDWESLFLPDSMS